MNSSLVHPFLFTEIFTSSEIMRIDSIEKKMEEGKVHDESTQSSRSCKIGWIDHNQHTWIREKIDGIIKQSNDILKFHIDGSFEPFQYTLYDQGGDHYDSHIDLGPSGMSSHRKLSVVVMLNDNYEGGQLEIYNSNLPISLTLPFNSAIVFPSYLLHRVTPVTAGVRKTLVCWYHGPKFK